MVSTHNFINHDHGKNACVNTSMRHTVTLKISAINSANNSF